MSAGFPYPCWALSAERGLDSLTATEISVNIEEHYGVILKPAALWECPSLRAVAEYVARSSK